jgi:CRISPR-associated protein Csm4
MPQLIPYQLAFHGGLHLGTRGVNLEEAGVSLPADTLFAALLDAWRRAGGDAADLAAPFTAAPPDPPFLLTSAFPYAGEVRFYPLPLALTALFSTKTLRRRSKAIKRIRYISEALLHKALTGERLDDDLFPDDEEAEPQRGLALQGGELWLTVEEAAHLPEGLRRDPGRRRALRYLKLWGSGRVPRVTVSRITSASTIFHAGRVSFAAGCGLWFGLAWRDRERQVGAGPLSFRQAFEQALALLQHEGLGGERSSGYGAFTLQEGEAFTLPDPTPGGLALLLSRYHPRQEELPQALTAGDTAYDLVSVAGWLRSPDGPAQRRKRLILVAEGSLVRPPAFPAGDVTDVRPDYEGGPGVPHPVYRYGLALALGWPVVAQASGLEKEVDHA